MHLVKQSQGFPHDAFHFASKPALNLDRKITGASSAVLCVIPWAFRAEIDIFAVLHYFWAE